MAKREIRLGIIGCGLMGRELASAAGRWFHLTGLDFAPRIAAACDLNPEAAAWFRDEVPGVELVTDNYKELLKGDLVDAVYCAVPHNLHQQAYCDAIRAGKHLLGEKPFGIDLAANAAINAAIAERPELVVRCSSQFPFHPGAWTIGNWAREGRFGRIIEVEAGFWHSSDLDPDKTINWKRQVEINGEYGCMGDLGMHVFHMPVRLGWRPKNVRALLSNVMRERPDGKGGRAPCKTWDNAILACEAVSAEGESFPMLLSTKRIAPGEGNTWFLRVMGAEFSASFSTKNPKAVRFLDYSPAASRPGASWTWPTSRLIVPLPGASSSSVSPTACCRCSRPSSTRWPTEIKCWGASAARGPRRSPPATGSSPPRWSPRGPARPCPWSRRASWRTTSSSPRPCAR